MMMVKQASCAVLGAKVVPRSLGRGPLSRSTTWRFTSGKLCMTLGLFLATGSFPFERLKWVSSGLPDKWHQCGGVKASQGKSPHAGNTCLWEMEGMKKEKGIGDR